MVSTWVERKVEDLILGIVPIPYADREIIEIGESVLGVDGLPGLPPLHLDELSTGKKILLLIFAAVPVLDLEYLDLVGLDPFKGAEHSSGSSSRSSGSSGSSGGSGGGGSRGAVGSTEVTFEAYAVVQQYEAGPFEITYDRVSGTVHPPDEVPFQALNSSYGPEEVKWVEAEEGVNFTINWQTHEQSYILDRRGEERLRQVGALDPGAHVRGLEGFMGTLKSFLLLPFRPFIGMFSGADAGGIGSAIAKLMVFLLIGGVIIGGAMSLFGAPVGQYLDLFGGQALDRSAAIGASSQVEQAAGTFQQARARVFCLMKGPSCLRQWRLNNTQRPGSNEVGQNYGLSIDRFQMGQSDQIDVAYQESTDPIPISFTVSNTRHGLKGINALNVSYRIRMIDSQRGLDDPYCDSGWVPVDGFDIRNAEGKWSDNDIYPGTSASTAFLTLTGDVGEVDVDDDFTLKGCEMLQPALGEYRTVQLDVKYDYFSQATLYFQAMSLQNLQSNPGIEKEFKDSETADTPVKAAISVNSPVLYDQESMERQPFGVRATLNTDEFDVRYKVKDLEVTESSQVRVPENQESDCQFDNAVGGSGDSVISSDRWFDTNAEPPIFGCVMELSDPGIISPTGETLTMGVEANYTVAKNEPIESFKVVNTRCSEFNCPLLVTEQAAEGDEYPWQTICTGVDAGNGCSIVSRSALEGDSISTENILNARLDGIERGEVAISTSAIDTNAESFNGSAFGLDEDAWQEVAQRASGYAIIQYIQYNGKEVGYVDLPDNKDDRPCSWKKWEEQQSRYSDPVVMSYKPGVSGTDCSGSKASSESGSDSEVQDCPEGYRRSAGGCVKEGSGAGL